MSRALSRRRLLVSAAGGIASLALVDMSAADEAAVLSGNAGVRSSASPLPPLTEVLAGDAGPLKVVNYAMYVQDRKRVDASRAEHQVYADALREHDRLVIGGPLLDDDGRPCGVLLVYDVASDRQAETLAQRDPFALKGAIAHYRLAEWTMVDSNVELLTASLVPAARRAAREAPRAASASAIRPGANAARTYVHYATYVSDRSLVDRLTPRHEAYARTIKAKGRLILGGPFADGSGALNLYRAPSKDDVLALMRADPFHAEGVFERSELLELRVFGLNAGLIPSKT